MRHLLMIAILTCLVLSLLALGCGQPPPEDVSQPPEPASNQPPVSVPPSPPMEAKLSLSDSPVLGKLVQVTATFTIVGAGDLYEPDITARIIMPAGFELVSGELEWRGDIIQGTPVEIKAAIRAVKVGWWKMEAKALGFTDVLYISVFEDSATVSDIPQGSLGIVHVLPVGPSTDTGDPSWLYPLSLIIAPSRAVAPLLGEPLKLEVTITSSTDLAEAEAFVDFYRMEGKKRAKVALEDILVEGDLTWHGSFRKDVPIQLCGTVILPEEGDWEIRGCTSSGEWIAVPMHSIFILMAK